MERVSSSQHVRPAPLRTPESGMSLASGSGHGECLDADRTVCCMAIHGNGGAGDKLTAAG
jgi:hypothetical protein